MMLIGILLILAASVLVGGVAYTSYVISTEAKISTLASLKMTLNLMGEIIVETWNKLLRKDKKPTDKMPLHEYLMWRYVYRGFSAGDHFALYDNACQAVRHLSYDPKHPSYIMAQRYMMFHGRLARNKSKKLRKNNAVT